jgi:hypothetical protein
MEITLTVDDAAAPELRKELRRRLGNCFPLKRIEEEGPADSETGEPTVVVRHIDDPEVDPIQLYFEDFVEDEVGAALQMAANRVGQRSEDPDERKEALFQADELRRAKNVRNQARNARGKAK